MTTAVRRPAYVGRERELEVLRRALAEAEQGRLSVVLIQGEPGIGKSRLLDEVLREAALRPFHVLLGKAEELKGTLPFAAIKDLLEADAFGPDSERSLSARRVLDYLVDPEPAGADLRYRVVEDVLDLVEKLSTTRPVVFTVDDLQWADSSSLLVFSEIARRLRHLPVALFGASRPVPTNVELQQLQRDVIKRGAVRLELPPLEEADASTLAASLLPDGEPAPSRELVNRAGGNPLLVVELARSVGAGEGGSRDASVRGIVLGRLEHLSPPTRELLQVASVLGTTFDVNHLALVLGRGVASLLPLLEEAQRAAILGDAGDRLAFRHDLVREAVYEDMPVAVRRALHLDAGRTLAQAGVPPLDIAEHFMLGASKGDTAAVRWLCDAAELSAPWSPATAITLYESARNLLQPWDPQRHRMAAAMMQPLLQCGRLPEGEALARQALNTCTDPEVRAQLRRGLIRILDRQDRVRDSLTESLTAEEGIAASSEATLKAETAFALLHNGRIPEAERVQQEAVALAEQSGDEKAKLHALFPAMGIATFQGHVAAGVDVARTFVDLHRQLAPWFNVQPLAFALACADQLEQARELLVRDRPAFEDRGNVNVLHTFLWRLLHVDFLTGRWDDAVAEGEAALAISQETGLGGMLFYGVSMLAEIALHRNQLERAERHLALLDAAKERCHGLRSLPVDPVRGLLVEARGDRAGAVRVLEEEWAESVNGGYVLFYTELGPELVRLLVATGDVARARAVVEQVEMSAERQAIASARGSALRSRGLLEGDADLLEQAVKVMSESPRLLARAITLRDAGTTLLSTAKRNSGLELLDESLGLFERLGADYDIRAVEAILRSAGVTRGRRGRRARPATGWEALTQTEQDVVDLIAQGFTAREIGQRLFISPRTVETHVAHVFTKLGLSSRAELRAAYARRSSGP